VIAGPLNWRSSTNTLPCMMIGLRSVYAILLAFQKENPP
jgi:hypothetical protein